MVEEEVTRVGVLPQPGEGRRERAVGVSRPRRVRRVSLAMMLWGSLLVVDRWWLKGSWWWDG